MPPIPPPPLPAFPPREPNLHITTLQSRPHPGRPPLRHGRPLSATRNLTLSAPSPSRRSSCRISPPITRLNYGSTSTERPSSPSYSGSSSGSRKTRSIGDILASNNSAFLTETDDDLSPSPIDDPIHVDAALSSQEAPHSKQAMQSEFNFLVSNRTWTLVPPPPDRRIVSCKWLLKRKYAPDGSISRYKARLVARGFSQVAGKDYSETYSHVLSMVSFRILVALAAHYRLHIHQMDVQTAFLHGELDEEIYMQQPPHFVDTNDPTHVCRLYRSIYDLKQANRQWYYRFHHFMLQVGYTHLQSDPNIYTRITSAGFVIIGLYVDDLVPLASSLQLMIEAKFEISQAFPMTDGGPLHYCLGMEVTQDLNHGTISISQRQYTREVLAEYNMLNCNPSIIPMSVSQRLTLDMCPSTPAEQHAMVEVPYRPSLGSVRYLVTCTRPDVCLDAGVHSRFMHNPGKVHWQSNKRMLNYLNHTNDFGITYHSSLNKDALRLIGWSDSNWGGDQDTHHSTSGFVFVLAGGAISWQSRKQSTVALSSTEAEYVAAAMAAKEGIWLQRLLEEL
ncbi:hypothetical protein L7F22_028138 [Adiantum nelumboides]|nr:hypothetical protein [Adiantum nelumboides]